MPFRRSLLVVVCLFTVACSASSLGSESKPTVTSPGKTNVAPTSAPTTVMLASTQSLPAPTLEPTVRLSPSPTAPALRDTPAPPTLQPPTSSLTVDETQNGQTISLRTGATLAVTLNSTYWTLVPPPDSRVLRVIMGPETKAAGNCPPGVGCGLTTATYRAVDSGKTEISATRVLCGEAVRCTPAQSTFNVFVVVVP